MSALPQTFVGREAELRRLRELLAAARAGEGSALAVAGPPGQGKTALLRRLREDAGEARVLSVTGVEAESEIPFGTLDALLRPLLDHLDAVPEVQRRALEGALMLAEGGPPEPLAIGAGTLSLLGAAAEEGPLLCLVDDLQWVDPASRRALLFAARRLSGEAVAIALASREEAEVEAELRGVETLRLGGLSEGESRDVLAGFSRGLIPEQLSTQLAGAAAGNPLALTELASRLPAAQLEGREEPLGPPPPHASAQELLAERVAALKPRAGQALLVAAASEDDEAGHLSRALGAAGLSLDDLVAVEAAGLVQLQAGRLHLRHPLVRSVAYHGAAPEDRRAAHAALAAALAVEDPRRVWHLAAAAAVPDEEVAAALGVEAARVRVRGGYASAGRAAARAAELTPDPEQRVERLLEAANDFELGGRYAEAARALEDALDRTEDPVATARIRGVQASLTSRRGDPDAARPVLLAQAEALRSDRPATAARFYLQAGFAAMTAFDLEGWVENCRAGLEAVPPDDPATAAVAAAQMAAAKLVEAGPEAAEPWLGEAVAEVVERPPERPLVGALEVYALLARSLIWAERWELAERMLDRLEADARRLNASSSLPYVLVIRSILDLDLGRWHAAKAAAAEGVSLAEESSSGLFLPGASALHALVLGALGEFDAATAAAQRALAAAGGGSDTAVAWARYALGGALLARGEVEGAARELAAIEGTGFPLSGSRPWVPLAIEVAARRGEEERAGELLASWSADAEAGGGRFGAATAARCRGLLAAEDGFEREFAAALELHEALPLPFERARTLLCLGERRRRAKRRAEARAPLREALAVFDELGAADWSDRARAELRATGGAVPARSATQLDELTAHEVQVAMLVAEGKTNREVAAALFLAPKTIEHHLTTIFRKLGLKRRTELARLFAGRDPDPGPG